LTQTGGPNTPAPGAAKGEDRFVLHKHPGLKGFDLTTLEHCPDFNERHVLLNGVTKAVPYPQPGYNCNKDYGLAQGGPNTPAPGTAKGQESLYVPHKYPGLKGFDLTTLEHCPDFNERHVLLNGVTKAVPYPQAGFNCNKDYGLAQGGPNTPAPGAAKGEDRFVLHKHPGLKGFDLTTLEHCPDFNERHVLLNGVTKAVPYPQPGYNCNKDYGLAQGGPNTGEKGEPRYVMPVHAGLKGFDLTTLEHCPDFNERYSLLNGVTKAVPYPQPGFNCNADYGLAQGGPNTPAPGAAKGEDRFVLHNHPGLKGFDLTTLEHCPDFNERHVLLNGVTKAVPYPQPGYNCNKDYGLSQGGPNTAAPGTKGEDRYVLHKHSDDGSIANLEHCPTFNERMTLLDGKTKAVSYPNKGFNCKNEH